MYFCMGFFSESGTKRHWSGFGKDSGSEDENETAPQKRLRLAKEYLVALEKRGDVGDHF